MNVEKALRQFARQQFGARILRDAEGHFQSEVKGKKGRIVIQNPSTVLERLQAIRGAKKVSEKGNTVTYKIGKDHEVSVTTSDKGNVLTLVTH